MAYVITAPCVADYSCLEICPVDCISPGPDDKKFETAEQLYIDPEVCIDCGACVKACPVLAIYEAGSLPEKWRHYEDINREYFIDLAQKTSHSGVAA
ncbi:MAG: 4Fe-4S binding protein [Porticoccaceae bacterium]|nr:4Fe-4S binding protein [Pseudomonadales bacterium]MCP5171101.1 4Fe-4S binding protein [Pseudomonadales bacterium]MCP5301660.1 4Fe-4S binding protein [Pseudomonadales bacterium]